MFCSPNGMGGGAGAGCGRRRACVSGLLVTCTQRSIRGEVWGLEASPLALAMISIKGATALATALATAAAIPAAIALAFVLVLAGGIEDIIRPDDLVQKITALPVLAAGGQVEVPAGLGAVLVVALPHGGAVLPLLARLLPAVALRLLLLLLLGHAW